MSAGRDDIRVATGFLQHVKIRRLRRELGPDAVLSLLQLWCYAAENHQDGVLGSPSDVEEASDWNGEPGALLDALKKLHLLESDGVTIHDWTHEQPWVVSKHKRIARAKHAASMRWACPEQCPPSPSPTPTQPKQPSPPPPSEEPPPTASKIPKKPPEYGPAEKLARAGKAKCSGGLDKWRETIASLRRFGISDEKIAAAIESDDAKPGMPPWDFAKLLSGYTPPNGKVSHAPAPPPLFVPTPPPKDSAPVEIAHDAMQRAMNAARDAAKRKGAAS